MKKMLVMLASAALFACGAGTVLLDNPREMNRTLKGDPGKTWVVWRSKVVPAKPNTWYRASVEIRTAFQPGPGNLSVRVRQVGENGKSLIYSNIATLKPSRLDYCPYSDVFLTRAGTVGLQVYYQLSKLDGTAFFRNLKLEELSEEEAEKIRSAYRVPPAYFTPPVCAYEGEQELPWGYRITAEFQKKEDTPAKIAIRLPQLSASASQAAKVNEFAHSRLKLAQPLQKGKYTVVMTALDSAGKVLAKEERLLRVIARPQTAFRLPVKKVEVDAEGNTLINGKPVLLNAIYHVYKESEVREVADAGFNTVIAWERTPAKYLEMLEWIRKYGLYSDCVIKNLPDDQLAELLSTIGGHPSIVSFDPEDEPDIKDIKPEQLQPKIERIRQTCPGIPMRISCSGPGAVKRFGDCAQIIGAHRYVIPFGGLPLQVKSTVVMSAP